jgi:hypothetical protein
LEEERRKNQRQERSRHGIAVKYQLMREETTMKKLPARIRPRFRSHSRHRSPAIRAVLKRGDSSEEAGVDRAEDQRRPREARTSGTGC